MEIYSTTRPYLVLSKLGDADKETFKKNIEAMNYFYIVQDAVLVCSDLQPEPLTEAIVKDIKEFGKVTILDLNARLLGKGKLIDEFTVETVFDK